jgi:hypothetical protein
VLGEVVAAVCWSVTIHARSRQLYTKLTSK